MSARVCLWVQEEPGYNISKSSEDCFKCKDFFLKGTFVGAKLMVFSSNLFILKIQV